MQYEILVIGSIFFVNLEDVTFLRHFVACQIFVIGGDLVNQLTVRKDFHDTVGGCLHELMVMGSKKDNSREFDQSIVQCSIGFQVKWVGGFIKNQVIGTGIIILDNRQRTFSPPERTRTFFTPSSPGKSILPRKPRT